MQNTIGTVKELQGTLTLLEQEGGRSSLAVGDAVSQQAIIEVSAKGLASIVLSNGDVIVIEAGQSICLSEELLERADTSPSDSVIGAEAMDVVFDQVLPAYTQQFASLLSAVEPIYHFQSDTPANSLADTTTLALPDILQQAGDANALDHYLRIDHEEDQTLVYLSHHGKFNTSSPCSEIADEILTFDSGHYSDNEQLFSLLVSNYLNDDQT
ncbi:MAG: hypothetical protein ACPG4U_16020 [Pseudomonadales bacterium]